MTSSGESVVVQLPFCFPCRHLRFGTECVECGAKLQLAAFALIEDAAYEHREGDDGVGSSPPQPTDHPSSLWWRIVGPWERIR